jgi:hypothetical protein
MMELEVRSRKGGGRTEKVWGSGNGQTGLKETIAQNATCEITSPANHARI